MSPNDSMSSVSTTVPPIYTLAHVFSKWQAVALEVMKNHTCFDLCPRSGKVVVFDSKLQKRGHLLRNLISAS